ncbi:hypothetical protein ABH935_009871 [Catenulispora sp. GAS73]|uniref:hypothetical protein n=1 Tax=Catenulispora sp. GAS73 TaxID=3156269 RepID=UPI0035144193
MVDADGQRRMVEFDGAVKAVRFGGGEFGLRGICIRQGTRKLQASSGINGPVERRQRLVVAVGGGERRTKPGAAPDRRAGSRRPGRWSRRPAAAR